MNALALLAAFVLAAVFTAAWLSASVAERRRRGLRARLTAVVAAPQLSIRAGGSVSLRRLTPVDVTPRTGLLSRLRRHLAEELEATGDRLNNSQLAIAAFVGAMLAAGLLILVLRWPLVIAVPLLLAAGITAATVHLRSAQRRFQQRFVELFPDALDVIVRAVRAGLPVLDSIEAAIGNIGEPVASEFGRLLDELRIGVDLESSLAHASNRIRVNDFRFFAATLVLQRRTGGSLAETLANLAGLIRRRKEIRLKANALSAESRATAYVIGVLPFVMTGIMYLVNPSLITLLFIDPRGKVILGVAIAFLLLGFMVMRSLIKRATR